VHITNISEAKSQLSALIEQVRQGKEVIIGIAGRPVAKLVPYGPGDSPRSPGALKGQIRLAEDFDDVPHDLKAAFGIDA
jgi:prevent-host-death family protein